MSWILLVTALIITFVVALIRGKLKNSKPIIEVQADEAKIRDLDLKPGEFVRMVPDADRKEVMVFTTRSEHGEKIGAINNGFIYRNVTKRNIEAKINSITGGKIMLEIVRTAHAH